MVKESILNPDVSTHSHSMANPLDKPPDPLPDLQKVQQVRKVDLTPNNIFPHQGSAAM